jgi:hypothetical protein
VDLLADFEDPTAARLVETGTPVRNGYWFPYNDMEPGCKQTPAIGEPYLPARPPKPSPAGGGLALQGQWNDCDGFGGMAGVHFDQTMGDKGDYFAPNAPYDLSGYTGITFWGMAVPGSENRLRVRFLTTDETPPERGGTCDTSDHLGDCEDSFGLRVSLPTDGSWAQVTARFSDAGFTQEGFGRKIIWNPAHVLSLQVRSFYGGNGGSYDFWVDDFYLIH